MSRLVDIEDVKDLINGLDSLPWEEEVDDLVKHIPTAYDVNKVVKQLEEIKAKPIELVYDVPLIDSIINIVKAGALE